MVKWKSSFKYCLSSAFHYPIESLISFYPLSCLAIVRRWGEANDLSWPNRNFVALLLKNIWLIFYCITDKVQKNIKMKNLHHILVWICELLLFYFNNWKILIHNILLETISTKIYSNANLDVLLSLISTDGWV